MTYARMSHLAVLAVALTVAAPSVILAQAPAPPEQTPGTTQNFSDEKLRSYAIAANQVDGIRQSYAPQLQAAETAKERQAVETESMKKQLKAVDQNGLSVKEYNDITKATQTDGEIASKVQAYMSQSAQ